MSGIAWTIYAFITIQVSFEITKLRDVLKKSVGGDVKKSITSSFFNRITFHLAVKCTTFQKINVYSLRFKFQTVAEKTAKNFRGLLYFPAPGIGIYLLANVRSILCHSFN